MMNRDRLMEEVPVDGGDPPAGTGDKVETPFDGDQPPAGAGDQPPAGAENWVSTAPEDWREQMAGDDEKALNLLRRVPSLSQFLTNYVAQNDKIRSGQAKNARLPENPTDEQVAEYREANGVPSAPEGYKELLPDGTVLSDVDERVMDAASKIAHEENIPGESMARLSDAFFKIREEEDHARVQQDGLDRQTTDRQLRELWGGDHQTNLNMVHGLLNQLPGNVKEGVMNARMADGKALFNSAEFVNFLVDLQRQANPAATVVPNSADPLKTVEAEIAELQSRMGTDEWYKDAAANQRLEQLLRTQEQLVRQGA